AYVLYWMIAARRAHWNYGLQQAAERARELGRPLVVLEALRLGYRWASPRLHRFIIQGMRDNEADFADRGVTYYPYVEPVDGAGRGLLEALAKNACLVVTDEFPCFFLPRMVEAAGERLDVRLETVDGNGILPLRAAGRVFTTAASFRRHLQKTLPGHLDRWPLADPLKEIRLPPPVAVPATIRDRWPRASAELLQDRPGALDELPLDGPAPADLEGGPHAGARVLARFLGERIDLYGTDRNHPDSDGSSGLSPYLHFGHIAAHEVVHRILDADDWNPGCLGEVTGGRSGWWGTGEAAEAFLDEIVTWREVGYVFCHQRPDDYDRYSSLPDWARETLREHTGDPRPYLYTLE
ncbi:MAG: deoxyribodipyrimidine photolyase, partial [Gemmatimonadetes bacterium]|nr:deoxyribodipyrimidine photolyase [Gemmatimonadota bacterium]